MYLVKGIKPLFTNLLLSSKTWWLGKSDLSPSKPNMNFILSSGFSWSINCSLMPLKRLKAIDYSLILLFLLRSRSCNKSASMNTEQTSMHRDSLSQAGTQSSWKSLEATTTPTSLLLLKRRCWQYPTNRSNSRLFHYLPPILWTGLQKRRLKRRKTRRWRKTTCCFNRKNKHSRSNPLLAEPWFTRPLIVITIFPIGYRYTKMQEYW